MKKCSFCKMSSSMEAGLEYTLESTLPSCGLANGLLNLDVTNTGTVATPYTVEWQVYGSINTNQPLVGNTVGDFGEGEITYAICSLVDANGCTFSLGSTSLNVTMGYDSVSTPGGNQYYIYKENITFSLETVDGVTTVDLPIVNGAITIDVLEYGNDFILTATDSENSCDYVIDNVEMLNLVDYLEVTGSTNTSCGSCNDGQIDFNAINNYNINNIMVLDEDKNDVTELNELGQLPAGKYYVTTYYYCDANWCEFISDAEIVNIE